MDDGANNEFRAAAGGDVDGDGRDEIIISRDDRIRVYPNPENGNEDNFQDHMLPTDNRRLNLLVGDLDRNGFTTGPILQFSVGSVDAVVPSGSTSQPVTVQVTNVGTDGPVGINAVIPASAQQWAKVNPVFATTPANFRVHFDATSLEPGIYNTTMTLRTNPPNPNVQNDNFEVGLRLTVVPPKLEPTPPYVQSFRLPCEPGPNCTDEQTADLNEPFTATVFIDGSNELVFSAAVLDVPDAPSGAVAAASAGGLAGSITGGEVDDNGNIIIYDDFGNSRTLASQQVSASAIASGTVIIDPQLTWITPTLDSNIVPATLSLQIDPSIMDIDDNADDFDLHREYAVVVLVADTRAGSPGGNVVLIPVELANVGSLIYISSISNQ
jgi:hypothetical protein